MWRGTIPQCQWIPTKVWAPKKSGKATAWDSVYLREEKTEALPSISKKPYKHPKPTPCSGHNMLHIGAEPAMVPVLGLLLGALWTLLWTALSSQACYVQYWEKKAPN